MKWTFPIKRRKRFKLAFKLPEIFFPIIKKSLRSLTMKEAISSSVLLLVILISGYFSFKSENGSFFSFFSRGKEKIYTEGLVGQIKHLNPLFVELNPVDRDICQLIFSGLSKYEPDSQSFIEDLATHTLSKDKKTYTFIVKPNIFWHDNQPLTVDDVYFTYHTVIQSPDFKNPILKANFQGVIIKKINPTTIEFTLKQPNSFFFSNLTVGLLPYHLLKDLPVAELEFNDFNKMPIGTGAYQVSEPYQVLNKDRMQVYLTAFEEYYNTKPSIKAIKFITFSDQKSLIDAKNSVHGIAKIAEPDFLQNLREDGRFNLYKYLLPQYTAVFFNFNSPYLKKNQVRLALVKAIDKEKLLSLIPNKRRLDTPLLELNQDDWIHQSSEEQAKGALYEEGWYLRNQAQQFREDDKGNILTLKFLIQSYPNNPRMEEETKITAQFLKDSWEKIGVKIVLESYEQNDLREKIKTRNFDILLYGQSLGYNLDTYSFWHSSQANEAGLNISNYRDANADSLIEIIRDSFPVTEKEIATKAKQLNKLASTIDADLPAVFLYTPIYYFAADAKIKNIELNHLAFPADRFNHIAEWQFNE